MKIIDKLNQKGIHISFEVFPPKTDAGFDKVLSATDEMRAELCLLFKKLACVAPVESNVTGKPVFVTVLYCVTDG